MTKEKLRSEILQKTRTLPESYIVSASKRITDSVLTSQLYKEAQTIFVYVSTSTEPDTRAILEDAWRVGKAVYVPKCWRKPHMDAIRINGFHELAPGKLGIMEPISDTAADALSALDLAIIPCVSASQDGRRLGHGAAYCDMFLTGLSVPKLCLCFDALLHSDIPMEDHDVWMDYVATENGIVDCCRDT